MQPWRKVIKAMIAEQRTFTKTSMSATKSWHLHLECGHMARRPKPGDSAP
jgi:hypothetical protein